MIGRKPREPPSEASSTRPPLPLPLPLPHLTQPPLLLSPHCAHRQISSHGKTTSLGDHATEVAAARAFDRAMINKAGRSAKTNFPMGDYAAELDELVAMPTAELVGLLRARARKQGAQTSRHRGVSLLNCFTTASTRPPV